MRTGSLLLLAVAVCTASAIAQEIVIEPTNGRAATASHVSRPAAVPAEAPKAAAKAAAKSEAKGGAKPENQERSAASKSAKKASLKQVAARVKTTPVEAIPSISTAPETTKIETPEVPAAKKMPARPEWAMTDTRDARSLQTEIAGALARDPKLTTSSIQVNVEEGTVTLEGRAAGSEERLQAERLTQSYAWNRKLVNHIDIVRTISAQK